MKHQSSKSIQSQTINPEKRAGRPTQFHTPEGPAEEFIAESRNDSNQLPPAPPVITPSNGKTSFWDIFRPRIK
jgi:hypothetical protein